jgi:acyl-coenzyme A thioesterase PaaI-like protein
VAEQEAAAGAEEASAQRDGRVAARDEQTDGRPFERDTAVRREGGGGSEAVFAAEVAPGWRAGRGPHGGYLAAMLLRALSEAVADPDRSPRSLTIHFARAPEEGPLAIRTVLERGGRSLSTLSARMEQGGRLIALALAAFSVPWTGPEISELAMPAVEPPDPDREPGTAQRYGGPPFTRHVVVQRRLGGIPFADPAQPMEIGAWLGLGEARPIDGPVLAFFADALIPAPFMRLSAPAPAPTIDLTIHFRATLPREPDRDPHELVFARVRAAVIHEGFFEEDSVIWAADGTVLAQSRQLAILMGQQIG